MINTTESDTVDWQDCRHISATEEDPKYERSNTLRNSRMSHSEEDKKAHDIARSIFNKINVHGEESISYASLKAYIQRIY